MRLKSGIFCMLILLLFSIGTASAYTIGNDIIDRNYLDGADYIAFIDPTLEFQYDGSLDSWDFWFSAPSGSQFATQIYRPTVNADDYELVYSLLITVDSSDGSYIDESISVDSGSFDVKSGDLVGWWFGTDGGVIPLDLTGTDYVQWTNYLAAITEINTPTIGEVYNFDHSAWRQANRAREYSIAANYTLGQKLASVPEPATILLLSAGLIGLAGFGKKKFQNK